MPYEAYLKPITNGRALYTLRESAPSSATSEHEDPSQGTDIGVRQVAVAVGASTANAIGSSHIQGSPLGTPYD